MQEKRLRTNAEDDASTADTTATKERLVVSSLRHICFRFVAANIEHVESLVGFPEVVGRALFSEVEKCGHLHIDNPACSVTMQLFLDAYGAVVLEHLSLRHAHLLIDQHFDLWQRFTHLRVLDLRGCHVGDGHDILSFVGQLEWQVPDFHADQINRFNDCEKLHFRVCNIKHGCNRKLL